MGNAGLPLLVGPCPAPDMTLDELNAADTSGFTIALGAVFENAPWVAARAAAARPFATVTALHQALFDQVATAPEAEQRAFLNGHPDLAGNAARAGVRRSRGRRHDRD